MDSFQVVPVFLVIDAEPPSGSQSVDVLIAPSTVVATSAINELVTQPNGLDSLNVVFASVDGNGSDLGFKAPATILPTNPSIFQNNADRITLSAGVSTNNFSEIKASFLLITWH